MTVIAVLVTLHVLLGVVLLTVHQTLFVLLLGFLWVGEVLWTFWDADLHSSMSRWHWALVVLLGGLLGATLYVLLGRDQPDSTTRIGADY